MQHNCKAARHSRAPPGARLVVEVLRRIRDITLLIGLVALAGLAAPEWPGSPRLDTILYEAVAEKLTPGAVLLVGQQDRVLHHKAYGKRSLLPEESPMGLGTIFDCASLTKIMATTPAVMMLVEEGKVRLNDPLVAYLPKFAGGKSKITIRHLLTHTSGLRPDVDLVPEWSGYETGVALAYRETPVAGPGERFIYSDINFILLGELVRTISGMPLDQFAKERVFVPLGMTETGFLPAEELKPRIAPTERLKDGTILHGVVHDPSTRFMGGVSGHAGVFSTAHDISRFCQMMLNGGSIDGVRILSPLSVAQMTTPQAPDGVVNRGLGWDINSSFSSVRGDLFPVGSFGHTGYTGPSLWIDPFTHTYVVLMTNRVHPTTRTSVVSLRSRVASAVASTLTEVDVDQARGVITGKTERRVKLKREPVVGGVVLTGLDVAAKDDFEIFAGKRIGLITNRTGTDREHRRNVDLLAGAAQVDLAAIFTPEHGFASAVEEEHIEDSHDAATSAPIHSLYQPERRRPTPDQLDGLDALVFDIQDVGARFYTYITTMAYAMEVAAKEGIPFYVLDRPNPINGVAVEGPGLDDELRSFIGYFPMPVRHGMTVGELALMFNRENAIGADLHVVRMRGWRREMWFDETGLPWVDPSPNIRNLNQAILYPGVALLEGLSNYSVGRGTQTPFEFFGADWMDSGRVAAALSHRNLPGVAFYPVARTPEASRFAGQEVRGIQMLVTDRDALESTRLGLVIADTLVRMYPGQVELSQTKRLVGDQRAINMLEQGESPDKIWDDWRQSAQRFSELRAGYLLY